MARLFYSELPTDEQIQSYFKSESETQPTTTIDAISSYLVMRKLHSELENSLECYFSEYNLSSGRFIILQLLFQNQEGLMPSDLADKVGVTQATISGLINNLSKAGLLERLQHKQDGRSFVIKLTTQGIELMSKLQPDFYSKISSLMNSLTPEEQKAYSTLSKKLLVTVETLCKPKVQ